ncbi:MAG TPA: GTP-dependent dephospho-CoA kinase family protein [Methanocorpusculum sp.]|nr:GTP-dependent dephospho-CoA kinase family protein [Methanocorpusculum sp.]
MLCLPENCRGLFKRPFGRLFSDFSLLTPELAGRNICTVGDVVTKNAVDAGFLPDIAVIDGVTKREKQIVFNPSYQNLFQVKNPAGTITDELVSVLEDAFKKHPAVVFVSGEEDLAVLPLIRILPDGWLILYGQPDEGAVLCEVNASLRTLAEDLLSHFTAI